MRKKVVAGNWKCNTTVQEGVALAKEVSDLVSCSDVTVVLGTPFTHLTEVSKVINKDVISIAAQNCAAEAKGAFTGEVSVSMIKSTGAEYVILGHSERREYYGETSETLNKKMALAFEEGLTTIYCCGEPLEIREAGTQNEYVIKQLEETIFQLPVDKFKQLIVAYEPIWAIGTGKTATTEQAQEIHKVIRDAMAAKFGQEVANIIPILYGGSCNASNAKELFANPDVDGGLIGGAALKAADFNAIITAF